MKRFLLIFTLLLGFSGSILLADPLSGVTTKKDSVFITATSGQSEIKATLYVTNSLGTSADLKWDVLSNTCPSSWGIGLCDKMSCYTLTPSTTANFTLTSGDSSQMLLDILPSGAIGSGTIKIRVYPKSGTPADGIVLTYYIDVTSGIENSGIATFTMYPNPVKDYLNINFVRKAKHHVEVYSILGKRVMIKDVDNVDFMKLSFSGLQPGRYIVMYRTEDGRVITKTISKD